MKGLGRGNERETKRIEGYKAWLETCLLAMRTLLRGKSIPPRTLVRFHFTASSRLINPVFVAQV